MTAVITRGADVPRTTTAGAAWANVARPAAIASHSIEAAGLDVRAGKLYSVFALDPSHVPRHLPFVRQVP